MRYGIAYLLGYPYQFLSFGTWLVICSSIDEHREGHSQ